MAPKERSFGQQISGNRQFNHEFTPEQRAAIITELEGGKSQTAVAEEFKTTRSTIYRTKKRWTTQHKLQSKPRKGRPRALTPREIRSAKYFVRSVPRATVKQVQRALAKTVSTKTIRRRLRELLLRQWRAAKRIPLTKEDREDRLSFGREWKEKEEELMEVCALELEGL